MRCGVQVGEGCHPINQGEKNAQKLDCEPIGNANPKFCANLSLLLWRISQTSSENFVTVSNKLAEDEVFVKVRT